MYDRDTADEIIDASTADAINTPAQNPKTEPRTRNLEPRIPEAHPKL
jgi:hypothetical protein